PDHRIPECEQQRLVARSLWPVDSPGVGRGVDPGEPWVGPSGPAERRRRARSLLRPNHGVSSSAIVGCRFVRSFPWILAAEKSRTQMIWVWLFSTAKIPGEFR